MPRTIILGGSPLELSNPVGTASITGPKAGLTISGGGLSGVFQVDAEGHRLDLGPDDHRRQGRRYGGGVLNDGTATLTNCTVSGNTATGTGGGVASYSGTTSLSTAPSPATPPAPAAASGSSAAPPR